MTQIFTIEPNPHWVIIDNFSKLPNGAAIYTYRSLNPTQFKPAFQDAGGTIPYGQPIVGFGNGTMPPIFWEFDSSAPNETYYIQVWSAPQNEGGVFLWDFDGLSGGGNGGGGTVITNNEVDNFVINGEFYRNAGNQVGSPSIPLTITLAPSNNAGIGGYANNVNDGPPLRDIIFAKSNQTDSDGLSFITVSPIGTPFLAPNPTPKIYVNYNCTVAGSGQTYKYIQFPIVKGLQNLSGVTVSVQLYARLNSVFTTGVTLTLRQFFGNGGSPSADVVTPIGGGPITLVPNAWTKVVITSQVIPSIIGTTIGSCDNDALFMQLNFPLSNTINLDFILPSMYLGASVSNFDFHTLDMVDSIISLPRTGDIRTSLSSFILGWILMNDGTIGNVSSNATARANNDTFQLFDMIWTTFSSNQSLAPMYSSSGTPVAYGATSVADFTANNQLSLTRNLGRVMAGAVPTAIQQTVSANAANVATVTSTASMITGTLVTLSGSLPSGLAVNTNYYVITLSNTTLSLATTFANAVANIPITFGAGTGWVITAFPQHLLGSFIGEENHVLLTSEMPAHMHAAPGGGNFVIDHVAGTIQLQGGGTNTNENANTASTGGGNPHNIIQPTVYMNVFIKL